MADVVESLNVMHKEVYPEGVPDLVPDLMKVQKTIGFSKADMLGSQYVQPVRLAMPGGFTHAKGDGTAGAFSLNDSKAGTQQKATITANQILLRDQMSYEDAGKAAGGKRSFVQGTKFFYEGLQKSMRKRLEIMLLYGSQSVGTIGAYSASNASYGNQPTITVNTAQWAPQIWAGAEGSEIDVQTAATSTVRGSAVIVQVDIENKVLVLSATVTGAVANDQIYFKGNFGNEMLGIHGILNTNSKFGIDGGVYSLWKASASALSSTALSFAAIKKAVGKAVAKGLDEDVTLFCNPGGWDDIASDIAALRTVDKSEVKRVEIGTEEIVFHSQNGKIEIVSHPMVKEGFAYGICTPYWKRIGAVDMQFGAPGFGGEVFFHLQTKAGVEARMYTNQAVFPERPGTSFVISGIVNT